MAELIDPKWCYENPEEASELIERLQSALQKIEAEDREEYTNDLGPCAKVAREALYAKG